MCECHDFLSVFTAHLCSFFNGKCPDCKCSLVKKHRDKMRLTGDFSIILNKDAWRKHSRTVDVTTKSEITCECREGSGKTDALSGSTEEYMQMSEDLPTRSKNWPLLIDKCTVQQQRLHIYLHKSSSFKRLLSAVLTQGSSYGINAQMREVVFLSTDQRATTECQMNLMQYRIQSVATVINNLLIAYGYTVCSENSELVQKYPNVVVGAVSSPCPPDKVLVRCGDVHVDAKKENGNVFIEDCLKLKYEQMEKISFEKYGEQVEREVNWDQFFQQLSEAAIKFELLSVRPSRSVTISLQDDHHGSSRGAPFILYNCARIAAIRSRFAKYCNDGFYPPLIPLEEIDFSLLTKEEEWELLTRYLMVYPNVVRSTVSELKEGQCYPNLLCQFLTELCNCYSSYYRRVRILVEPRAHLVPLIHARLYLLHAIECVLHNGLRLLGMEPVSQM